MGDDVDSGAADELLSVAEAALVYGLPQAKIRKMISLRELDGVHKVRGEYGLVWRIPAAAFEARGLTRQAPLAASPDAMVTVDLAELRRTINGLTGTLRIERQRLVNKETELQDALLQVRQLRSELRREQESREQAEARLARLRAAVTELAAAEQVGEPRNATLEASQPLVDLTGIDRFALEAERRRPKERAGSSDSRLQVIATLASGQR